VCGYDLLGAVPSACPACAPAPREPSLAVRVDAASGVRAGLLALPMGLRCLLTTRGVKRWLVPPATLAIGAFAALTWWLWSWAERGIDSAHERARTWVDGEPSWWRATLEWLFEHAVFVVLAKLSGAALVFAASALAMWWTFSLVYELLAGPFLDRVHGTIEERWFGLDPRDARERPQGIGGAACAWITAVCAGSALVVLAGSFALPGKLPKLAALCAAAAVFVGAARWRPAYGRWLKWTLAVELRTLAASLQASLISAAMLVFALPLLLVPLIGGPLFSLAAGFTTAVSLLDIPMSRRRWPIGLRVRFVARNLLAVLAFGCASSLVFLVPVLGSLALVPVASVGGLWLVCRLDKSALGRS
jgi:uncharacterized protein involved in cysteine biosynthesis